MQFCRRLTRCALYAVFCAALLWVAVLLCALGGMYLTRTIPVGFSDWIVDIQVRDLWPERLPHSLLFYQARFFALTALAVSAGIISAICLRKRAAGCPR
jgi:hypothetical protein